MFNYPLFLHNTTADMVIVCCPDVIFLSSTRTLLFTIINLVIADDAVLALTAITPIAVNPFGEIKGRSIEIMEDALIVICFVSVVTVVTAFAILGFPIILFQLTLPALLA